MSGFFLLLVNAIACAISSFEPAGNTTHITIFYVTIRAATKLETTKKNMPQISPMKKDAEMLECLVCNLINKGDAG